MALGLVMAFAMPAAAVDVKVTGAWYMGGWYVDNASGLDKSSTFDTDKSWGGYTNNKGTSSVAGDARHNRGAAAYYTHRLSLSPTFQVVEGLKLVTSLTALNTLMGDNSWKNTSGGRFTPPTTTRSSQGASGAFTHENIEIGAAYVNFKTAYGTVDAGYVTRPNFGTTFINDIYTYPGVRFTAVQGPITYQAAIWKLREWKNRSDYGVAAATNGVNNDADSDAYEINGIYKFKAGEAGFKYEMWRDGSAKARFTATASGDGTGLVPTGAQGFIALVNTANPYVKARFGNFYVEGEAYYKFGNWRKYETFSAGNTQQPDIAINAMGAFVNGRMDLKPFYVGGMFAYVSGDDMQANDKVTGSVAQFMGENYFTVTNTLILWNNDYYEIMGATVQGNIMGGTSAAPAANGAGAVNPRTGSLFRGTRYLDNAWFYQIYGGMSITPKMNVEARLSYASADKKPKMGVGSVGDALTANNAAATAIALGDGTNSTTIREFTSDKYGTEIDFSASYKIYDNLTYSVGAGYLWVGDYFKGYDVNAKLKDNYILTHKLMLTF
jgi:hypothetical protein